MPSVYANVRTFAASAGGRSAPAAIAEQAGPTVDELRGCCDERRAARARLHHPARPRPGGRGLHRDGPALPGVVTQGRTVEEAIALAKDAVALHIAGLVAHGEPVPEERERPQVLTIRVAA
jgi:predicted RNase H-like HicB family nuclease